MKEDTIITIGILGGFVIGFLFGVLTGISVGTNSGYKQGQLDYAAGKIEYTIQYGRTIQYLDGKK